MSRENVVDSFTGLFNSLQRHQRQSQSDEPKGILSGCEAELHELMRQIDIMVNAKKVEWDGQLHVLQFNLDKKKKENGILRIEVEAKVHEAENLKHQVAAMDHSQRELINEYEDKLSRLRDEVDKLRRDHEKLQKKGQKHNSQIQGEKDRVKTDLQKRELDLHKVQEENKELKMKMRNWDNLGRTHQERIKGLETENLTLSDKNDILEKQTNEIQDMLSQRKHTLENLEKSHQIEMVELEKQLNNLRGSEDDHKETITNLQKALEKHQTKEKEKDAELAFLDGRLRHAHEVTQALEHQKEQLSREMVSKCDLLKRLQEKQRHQKEDLSILEKDLHRKEEAIRDLQEVGVLEESSTIMRLREDLRIRQTELSSRKETETFLKTENERLKKSLMGCEVEFKKSNIELIQKNEQLSSQGQDEVKKVISENVKLRNDLQQLEDSQSYEMEGMKSEVNVLTSDLHRRDQTIASMSEKIKRLERDLRNSNSEYDQGMAELHVVTAQLEDLRLENHHLNEATFEGELRDLDLYHSNQQFLADLQEENKSLREESVILREDVAQCEARGSRELPDCSRILSSTARTATNVDTREKHGVRQTIRFRDETNSESTNQGVSRSTGDNFSQRRLSSSSTMSCSELDEPRGLSYGDLKINGSDYERAGSPTASRRSSITANFVAEETRREKELEKILDGRLNDLKINTKNVLGGYRPT